MFLSLRIDQLENNEMYARGEKLKSLDFIIASCHFVSCVTYCTYQHQDALCSKIFV